MSAIVLLVVLVLVQVDGREGEPSCITHKHKCDISSHELCCGYPFYDCIPDTEGDTCESLLDYPELYAEFLLRVRESVDDGRSRESVSDIRQRILDGRRDNQRRGGGRRGGRRRTTSRPRRRTTTRRRSRND